MDLISGVPDAPAIAGKIHRVETANSTQSSGPAAFDAIPQRPISFSIALCAQHNNTKGDVYITLR